MRLFKRKPVGPAQGAYRAREPLRRRRQQNVKVTEDCAVAFAKLALAQGFSKAALFEDLVAERLETLQRQGVMLNTASSASEEQR